MTGQVVTFDFHDTLAVCDDWFALEVRELVPAFLTWQARQHGESPDEAALAVGRVAYRRLRQEIIGHGREIPAEECLAAVLAEIGRPTDPDEIAAGVTALMRDALAQVHPLPGAVETVRAVATARFPLAVVSSAVHHPFVEWTLARFGLGECFAAVITSASAGYYKSRIEIYQLALAATAAAAARSVHVGNSYRWDVEGARRAGMHTVWLRHDPREAPDGQPPDVTLATLENAAGSILDLLRAVA